MSTRPSHPLRPEEVEDLNSAYRRLREDHITLQHEFDEACQSLEFMQNKYKRLRESFEGWRRYWEEREALGRPDTNAQDGDVSRKRKRENKPAPSATPTKPQRPVEPESPSIKSENFSQATTTMSSSNAQSDSQDLDRVGQPIITPRKAVFTDVAQSIEASWAAIKPEPDDTPVKCESPTQVKSHKSMARRDTPSPPRTKVKAEPATTPRRDALQPLSTNKRSQPRTNDRKKRPKREESARKIGMVAEDGDVDALEPGKSSDHKRVKPEDEGNLSRLLNSPAPQKTPLKLPRGSDRTPLPRCLADTTPRASGRDPGTSKSVQRLRNLPLSALSPESFKINPAHNAGHTFAYTETVRDRWQRSCLSGCTNPSCCGDTFRKVIGMNPAAAGDGDDDELLREFLPQSRHADIPRMSLSRKKEFLLQARTKRFANQHGRHRYRFRRKRTPPGFWRTDMPTSQEMREDAAEAAKMEMETVKERRMEALKSDGRWMFRDE